MWSYVKLREFLAVEITVITSVIEVWRDSNAGATWRGSEEGTMFSVP
jgi:hypothetical protein